ncbi:MAG: PAS domain S-box protein [bacterium]|nr:PAS domain S-box protein [bacterium]
MAHKETLNVNNYFEQNSENYLLLIDNLADGVALVQDGKHIFVNQSFAKIFGYAREELIGTESILLIAPEELERMREQFEKRRQGDMLPSHYETVGIRKDGQRVYLEVFGSMINYAGKLTNHVTVRDISYRKQTEERIQQLNQQLERRILELLIANQSLAEYDYTISHELRTPLQNIKGAWHILNEYYSSQVDSQGIECIRLIEKNIKIMETLIENILTYAKFGRAALHFQEVELSELVQSLYAELSQQQPEPHRKLVMHMLPKAFADPVMLREILFNLLENAFKFTQHTPQPIITIGGREEADQVVFYIKDNGIGLAKEDIEKIFDIFHRGNNSAEYTGSGLGLAIVRRAIQRHQGRIWAENNADAGLTIYFTLPKPAEG